MSNSPAVSVVIPLYNKQRTIARAIDSIRAQTFSEWELIVVDDGSTDQSVERLLASGIADDSRFTLLRQSNAGPGAARNAGARQARGRWLAFLDADDEWRPAYLERAVHALVVQPGCGVHVTAYDTGHYRGLQQNLLHTLVSSSGRWSLPLDLGPAQTKAYVDACQISCVMIEAALFRTFGGFYEKERCTFGEDIYLLIQVVFLCDIYFDIEPLVLFHVEDSELGVGRTGPRPVRPHLLEPEPIQNRCPAEHRMQLQALFAYYRMLETEKFARCGDWQSIRRLRAQFQWPSSLPITLRLREWKVPLRTFAGGLQRILASTR